MGFQIFPSIIIILITIGLFILSVKLYVSLTFFTKRKIPHQKPRIVLGNLTLTASLSYLLWELYKNSGKHKVFGYHILWTPALLVKDPELIKQILVKSHASFYNRGLFLDEKLDPLSSNLFALENDQWKSLRTKLSPVFTSGKTKLMFPAIAKFAEKLVSHIQEQPCSYLECYKLMSKYTLSNIADVAFGLDLDVFEENSKFMEMAVKINEPSYFNLLRTFLVFQLKGLVKFFNIKLRPDEMTSFYMNLVQDVVLFREENRVSRSDFMQLLIDLKNKSCCKNLPDNYLLTMNRITAQAFVFLLAGFETSALQQSWALYELATNPDIQSRLQEEVDHVTDWTYESLMSLRYLDMVLNETLRKYPVAPFLIRKCTKDFPVPDSNILIEKDLVVYISLLGLHRDPGLFPDPDKFDPERFGTNPPHSIKPFSFLPFGEGPRYCIGEKFGKMQSTVGIATLMKHFTVEITETSRVQPQLDKRAFQITSASGFWLRFKRRL